MPENTQRSEAATFRRGFSRGLGVGLIPLMVCLALSGGLLYAQSGGDALFIDQGGRVGIGNTAPQAALDVTGAVKAQSFEGVGAVPKGAILMWRGPVDALPQGWALCDGKDGKTPDLRDRFVLGAGGKRAVEATGGDEQYTLSVAQIPPHDHTGFTAGGGSHSHQIDTRHGDAAWGKRVPNPNHNLKPWALAYDSNSAAQVGSSTGIEGDHKHGIPKEGGGQPYSVLPPFYALAFIMKVD